MRRSLELFAPSDEARTPYGMQQEALVRAAAADGAFPVGFDPGQVQLLREVLLRKRRRSVERTWPALAGSLGASFERRFTEYARANPLREAHATADGFAFVSWLGADAIGDPVREELLLARARLVVDASGVRPRRLPFVGSAHLAGRRRLLLVTWLPKVGLRSLELPLPVRRLSSRDPS